MQNNMKLKWAKKKETWCMNNWMKVIFNYESRIRILQADNAEILQADNVFQMKYKKMKKK